MILSPVSEGQELVTPITLTHPHNTPRQETP